MSAFKPIRSGVCIAALFTGSAAMAEVTAQQVWDDWQTNLGIYGSEGVTIGSESLAGGVLTVTDLALNTDDGTTTVTATLPLLVFTENGDGTVSVTMSEEYPFNVVTRSPFGEDDVVSGALRQRGMTMTVSGMPEEMTYELTADRYAIEIDEITEGGSTVIDELTFAFNNLAGRYVTTTAALRGLDYQVSAGSLDLLINLNNEFDDMIMTVSGKINDLEMDASIAMPLDMDMIEPDDMFNAGFALAGGYIYGAADYIFDVTQYGATTTGTISVDGGGLDVSFDKEAMAYSTTIVGVEIALAPGDMVPFPVTLSASEIALGLMAPLSQSAEPSEFGVFLTLADLAVNDEIWSMLDPGAVLPRDPLTAIIDLTGKATLLFDILDPSQADAMAMAAAPGELNEIALNELRLAVGGALLTGEGAFTFDNDDMMTIPGFPRPEGSVTLSINGLNGLIDNLVQMGLIPEEEVMMPRMMMGMFATTVGPDELTSTIEVNSEGHIIANGQRIQ